MERNILLGVVAMVIVIVVVVVVALNWDTLTTDDDNDNGDGEIPEGVHLTLTKPEHLKEYTSHFPVEGVATSSEGFGENTTVQWMFKGDPIYGEWTDDQGWDLKNDNKMEIYFELNMGGTRIGTVVLAVRVFDGEEYSNVVEVPIKLK